MKKYESNSASSGTLDLLPLTVEHEAAAMKLRATLRDAGCVFNFSVSSVARGSEKATEAQHRFALQMLFDTLQAESAAHWQSLVDKDPTCGARPPRPLNGGVAQALCTPLDARCVVAANQYPPKHRVVQGRDLKTVSWFEWLAQAFDSPPYGVRTENPNLHRALFPRFCQQTGLLPGCGITALDWVGNPDREPARSNWSPYFEEGKEWWGIWCLTVWNPKQRTLAAIAASATD